MAGPWEKYQTSDSGPWSKYQTPEDKPENKSLGAALFPRAAASGASGQSIKKQLGAAALDMSSGLLRVPGAAAAAAASKIGLTYDPNIPKGPPSIYDALIGNEFGRVPEGTTFLGALNNVNQGKNEAGNPSLIAKAAADPATVPATVIGAAIPIPGKNPLLRMLGATGAGAAQGGTYGAIHQADNLTQGGRFSLPDATREAAWAGGAGLGLGVAGELAQKTGGQIIKSYLKGGQAGKADGLDKDWVINNEMGGSASQMTQKAESALTGLKDKQAQIISQKGNVPVPGLDILHEIEQQINSSKGIAKNAGNLSAAQIQLKKYFNDYVKIADPKTGEIPLELAWEFKKKVANDASELYKAARSGGDVKSKVAQGVSAAIAEKFNAAMEKAAPELTALNPEFSKLIPFAKALAKRNVIAGQHNPIGLDELAALEAGSNFMVHGHWEGGMLPLLQKASKSPYAGQKLRELGKGIEKPKGRNTLVTLAELITGKPEEESP